MTPGEGLFADPSFNGVNDRFAPEAAIPPKAAFDSNAGTMPPFKSAVRQKYNVDFDGTSKSPGLDFYNRRTDSNRPSNEWGKWRMSTF